MLHDLRFALRMLGTHRWFSVVVVVTLALGIGVNTTVFTLVNAVLFKPVPVPGGERLVTVVGQNVLKPDNRPSLSYPDYQEFRANQRSFQGLEAISGAQAVISENGNPPERYRTGRVTPGLFSMLQTPPVIGRGMLPEDARPGADPAVLIGYHVWKTRYGGDAGVIGRAVRVDGTPATIVGVMPEGFKFPNREDIWIPLIPTTELEKRTNRQLQLFGLLKPGMSITEAGADLAIIAQRLATTFPDTNKDMGVLVRTFHDTYNGGSIRLVFLTMLGAVGFVLLIACANVANLMLSRAIARQREMAMRAAVGASRGQMIRQLLVESVLLSVVGGVLGLGIAVGGVHAFDLATQDVGKPYWIQFTMDYVVFGYFAAISVLCGLVFGLAPALRASRVDLNSALKDGAPSAGGRSGGKLTATLVVLQFALTVVLLAGAGVMVRSFFAAQTLNAFVPATHIFSARVNLPGGKDGRYAQREERVRFFENLQPNLARLPGVTHAAIGSHLPGSGSDFRNFEIEGKPLDNAASPPRASVVIATPGYAALISLPIVGGRDFADTDGDPGKESALVTRAFAAKYWPNQNALGGRFRFLEGSEKKPGPWIAIVGICGDVIQRPQESEEPPLVYLPHRQEAWGGMTLLVRSAGNPATLAAPVRSVVQASDPDLPLFSVETMTAVLARSRWALEVFGTLFLSFAIIALLMASVGLYAVVAQATGRRTREIGIRMALGATAGRIMQLVLKRGLTQLAIGLVLGLGGAFAATRVLGKMQVLFRVSPQDPLVFLAVTLVLIGIGVFACWLPARRAAALHPVTALRQE